LSKRGGLKVFCWEAVGVFKIGDRSGDQQRSAAQAWAKIGFQG
jgi:hypothetical protein